MRPSEQGEAVRKTVNQSTQHGLSEDFYADTAEHFTEVLDFLGVTQYELGDFAVHNAAAASSIDPETRSQLVQRYAEPNRRFYELIGADLGWE